MRGKVSDQDLTDYAMNELPPDERLYVESMLGVSEECRADVYQMLDLGEMLKEGFEADERLDESGAELLLNEEQRAKVLTVPRWNFRGFFRQAAAVALLAAGTAFALTRQGFWQDRAAQGVAEVKEAWDDFRSEGLAKTAAQYTEWLKAKASADSDWQFVAAPAAVCTPPPMPVVVEM